MSYEERTAEFDDRVTPAIGEVISAKYRLDFILGTGGMGKVFGATHLGLGQRVAIKVLTVESDDTRREEAQERFLREGRAMATLVSDHVVRIYDVGTLDNGAPFMVMEQLQGNDLAHLLQRNGPFAIDLAAECVRQAAAGIAAAHAQGIVHRDLKPSNLFLAQRSDGSPLIKVLDFGISKNMQVELESAAGSLTATRSVLGTPFYMSPEQVRDAKKVDFRTDVWSLGLILHELLSGSPAFEGTTLPGVCAAIVADPPAALRLKRPEVPVELENIVLKCLEKEPTRRFQTAAALMHELAQWTGRVEGGAPPPFSDRTIRSSPMTMKHPELSAPAEVLGGASSDTGTMASAVLSKSVARVISNAEASQRRRYEDDGGRRAAVVSSATPLWKRGAALALVALLLAVVGVVVLGRRAAPSAANGPATFQAPSDALTAVSGAPRPAAVHDAPMAALSAAPSAAPEPPASSAPRPADRAPTVKPKAHPTQIAPSASSKPPSDIFMQR
ncbi:MAG: serine/threonine-protein kinase [Pseudomonadota bacterium]